MTTQGAAAPAIEQQREFWDRWSSGYRFRPPDRFQFRQAEQAREVANRLRNDLNRPLRILDVGCGTGWLCAELVGYGDCTGTDLSEQAIAYGTVQHRGVRLIAGSFDEVELGDGYDLVVSADVIAHVADQSAFVARVASLLNPGGTFLLMTQNPFVWRRSSYLSKQGEGQIRDWPTMARIRELLREDFEIRRTTSIVPGGDRGVLRATGNRAAQWAMRNRAIGSTVTAALEAAMVGREFVVEARRK